MFRLITSWLLILGGVTVLVWGYRVVRRRIRESPRMKQLRVRRQRLYIREEELDIARQSAELRARRLEIEQREAEFERRIAAAEKGRLNALLSETAVDEEDFLDHAPPRAIKAGELPD
jgi:hypothetical protein